MDKTNTHTVNTLLKRIYRNKLRIREHFYTAIIAIGFFAYCVFIKHADTNTTLALGVLITVIVFVDILMSIWHKHWIKKWREELTKITGIDYTALDKPNEGINNLTKEEYDNFIDTLQVTEVEVLKKALKKEKLNLLEKGILSSLEAKFKLYNENRGIVCELKLTEIDKRELKSSNNKKRKRAKK